jgi:hypothetical protein
VIPPTSDDAAALKDAGVPSLKVVTDHAESDTGQLRLRVEAFLRSSRLSAPPSPPPKKERTRSSQERKPACPCEDPARSFLSDSINPV